jgi:hypothetical protein
MVNGRLIFVVNEVLIFRNEAALLHFAGPQALSCGRQERSFVHAAL